MKTRLLRARSLMILVASTAVTCLGGMSIAAQSMSPSAGPTPVVVVQDQAIDDSRVVVLKVVSPGPGWMVIHADNGGKPGPVLGYAALREGENLNVVVAIDAKRATPLLYAMLHVDAGVIGTYEFPGADVPTMNLGAMVSPSFKAAPQAY